MTCCKVSSASAAVDRHAARLRSTPRLSTTAKTANTAVWKRRPLSDPSSCPSIIAIPTVGKHNTRELLRPGPIISKKCAGIIVMNVQINASWTIECCSVPSRAPSTSSMRIAAITEATVMARMPTGSVQFSPKSICAGARMSSPSRVFGPRSRADETPPLLYPPRPPSANSR